MIPRQSGARVRAWTLDSAIRVCVAAVVLGAAAIHAAVTGEHVREFWLFGVFFLVTTVLQAAWAVLVVIRPTRRTLFLGGVGSATLAAIWIVSRTAGLPVGPGTGRESVAALDALATAFEVAAVAGVAVILRGPLAHRRFAPAAWLSSTALCWVGVATVTGFTILGSPPEAEDPAGRVLGAARPHVVHLVLFIVSVGAAAVYGIVDRGRVRRLAVKEVS